MASAANVPRWVDLHEGRRGSGCWRGLQGGYGGLGWGAGLRVWLCESACVCLRERKGGGGVAQGWGKGPSLQDQHKWNCIDSVNCRVEAWCGIVFIKGRVYTAGSGLIWFSDSHNQSRLIYLSYKVLDLTHIHPLPTHTHASRIKLEFQLRKKCK